MTADEVRDRIKALPPAERPKVVEFVEHEIEAGLLPEEIPARLGAIEEGIHSLETEGGRESTRAQLEQKVRRWAGGASR